MRPLRCRATGAACGSRHRAGGAQKKERHAQSGARADAQYVGACERVAEEGLHLQAAGRQRHAGEKGRRGFQQPDLEDDLAGYRVARTAGERAPNIPERDRYRAYGQIGGEERREQQRKKHEEQRPAGHRRNESEVDIPCVRRAGADGRGRPARAVRATCKTVRMSRTVRTRRPVRTVRTGVAAGAGADRRFRRAAGVPRVPERLGVSVVPEVWAARAAERLGDEVRNRLAQPAAMRAAESGVKGGSDFISHKNRKIMRELCDFAKIYYICSPKAKGNGIGA